MYYWWIYGYRIRFAKKVPIVRLAVTESIGGTCITPVGVFSNNIELERVIWDTLEILYLNNLDIKVSPPKSSIDS